jgi:ribonuclease P protein component
MTPYTFHKDERLCSRKLIGTLFLSGRSFLCYPLKVVYALTEVREGEFPVQAGFTVPKKNFKRAVKRNLLKRRIREAYRLQKQELYTFLDSRDQQLAMMFIYVGKEPLSYRKIEGSVKKAILRLKKELNDGSGRQA